MTRDSRLVIAWIRPYWKALAFVALLSILSTLLSLALPYLSKQLVDDAILARN